MAKLDHLNNLIEGKIRTYVSDQLGEYDPIQTELFVNNEVEAFHNATNMYFEGYITQEDFTELVNMMAQEVKMLSLAQTGIAKVKQEWITRNVIDIVLNTTNEFVAGDIQFNVDPDDPWPRK